jgi:zinc protease
LRQRSTLASALLLALAAGSAAAAERDLFPYPVHTRTLANGMQVVAIPYDSPGIVQVVAIPYDSPGIVAYVTVVRTGSRDEVEAGHSGFAHFFEHVMFRGTKKYPAERYNDVLKRMGADSNAFTSDDTTVYHIVGPAAELAAMFDLEADRFQNLRYTEEAFRTEAGAILGEYSKNASSPFLPMAEKLRDLAFDAHTYEHTTMGFLADIKRMPEEYQYSLSFFDRFYRPDNVTLVVVGDLQPERVFALAEQHYAGWKRGYQAPAVKPEGPPAGQRRAHLDWPTPINPQLMMAWRTPAYSPDRDWAATAVLEQLLFAESAPLYQELVVDKQLVDFVSGGASRRRDPYLFTVTSRVRGEEALPKVESTVQEHLRRLREQPVDTARLARVKSHLRYAFGLGLDTPREVAMQVAEALWLTGDVATLNRFWAEVDRVEPADVQRVARELFQDQRLAVVTLSHPAVEPPAAVEPKGGAR